MGVWVFGYGEYRGGCMGMSASWKCVSQVLVSGLRSQKVNKHIHIYKKVYVPKLPYFIRETY